MQHVRRWFSAALVLAAALAPASAQAQSYPSQDIHFICAFPAGSGADVLVRYFAEKLRLLAGRTIIVENKVGAAGNIAGAVPEARHRGAIECTCGPKGIKAAVMPGRCVLLPGVERQPKRVVVAVDMDKGPSP